jgi:serine/threonine-protein kinase HipA
MRSGDIKEIIVYADFPAFSKPLMMGTLSAILTRGKEVFSFEYTAEWLENSFNSIIDPDLQFYTGKQFLNTDKCNFGIFLDSSPDRWGRLLLRRKEAFSARAENRSQKILLESDYLLGVNDKLRSGAIRFKCEKEGPFLNIDSEFSIPPLASLRQLEHASLELEDENLGDEEYLKWLNMLVAPGSSLGGARPKAGVIDPDGDVWIAKFPSKKDDKDIGAWEMVVAELADKAGITIAEGKLLKLSSDCHTYLSKRFDRDNGQNRVHFASAMTMLGYNDGQHADYGVSYLEIVEFLMQHGADVDRDLEELWRRIVFSICVSNTDDHLRNHGFLLTDTGWVLSPAYDINPNESGRGLSLNISENDNSLEFDLAREVAPYFRLNESKAEEIIELKDSRDSHNQIAAQSLQDGFVLLIFR